MVSGLIYPLFYIDAKAGASKPAMLSLFIPLSLALLGYYGYELYRLATATNLARENLNPSVVLRDLSHVL